MGAARHSSRSSNPDKRWLALGRQLAERLSRARWELADWIASAPAGMVDDELAEALGVSVSLVRNSRWIARKYEPDRRRADLSYTHHLVAAALPPETADELLGAAAEERWTVARLRLEASAAAVGAEVERQRSEDTPQQGVLSADWLISARRVERNVRERLISAAAALEVADSNLVPHFPTEQLIHRNPQAFAFKSFNARSIPLIALIVTAPPVHVTLR